MKTLSLVSLLLIAFLIVDCNRREDEAKEQKSSIETDSTHTTKSQESVNVKGFQNYEWETPLSIILKDLDSSKIKYETEESKLTHEIERVKYDMEMTFPELGSAITVSKDFFFKNDSLVSAGIKYDYPIKKNGYCLLDILKICQ